uniref:ADP-ribose pyrophosphatase, mitochondrial n=1 Tax=Trichuris muris TaxID=70415 RepID=A0A5S6QYV1_TRIMR
MVSARVVYWLVLLLLCQQGAKAVHGIGGSKIRGLFTSLKHRAPQAPTASSSTSGSSTTSSAEEGAGKQGKCRVYGIGKVLLPEDLIYPGTTIRRECAKYGRLRRNENYSPSCFTRLNLTNADPDEPGLMSTIRYNEVDKGINRRSVEGTYKVENNVPLNPKGRTGICGRGHLRRWGPNHISCFDIRRQIANDTAQYKQQLQVKAKLSSGSFVMSVPCDYVDDPDVDPPLKALRPVVRELIRQNGYQRADSILTFMFRRRKLQGKFYRNSRLNTDNAWIEKTIWKVIEYDGYDLGSLDIERMPDVSWKIIDVKPI